MPKNKTIEEREIKEIGVEKTPEVDASESKLSETPKYKVEEKENQNNDEVIKNDQGSSVQTNPQPRKITSFSQLDTNLPSNEEKTEDQIQTSPENENKQTLSVEVKEETSDVTKENESDEEKTNKKNMSSEEIKDWLKEVRPEKEDELKKEKQEFPFKIFIWIFVVLVLLGALAGGIYYYKTSLSEENNTSGEPGEEITQPTQIPKPIEESETEEVDLKDYQLNVINGSGVAGEAGNVSGLLQTAGFSKIDSGNAETYNFTTTVVELKEEVPSGVYEKIEEALSEDYVVGKSEDNLDESSTYDIVITVGSKKKSE